MKTLIIDGNNLIHRTYWTAKNQVDDEDQDKINNFHVYFTLNAIKSYVAKYKPAKTVVCWDEKPDYEQNERKKMFAGYKANRSSDASPHQNNQTIRNFLETLGIPSIYPRKLEADDVITFLCDYFDGNKVIVSVDKDFLQLASSSVLVFDPIRKREVTDITFEDAVKCKHEEFLVKKCLEGDKSDNVPGITGFGKVKIGKYLEGKVQLTEAEQEIYDRNMELFRLDKYRDEDNKSECEYYTTQIETAESIIPDYNRFIELCASYDMNSILNRKQDWYGLFFVKQRLQSLFS